MTPVLQMIRSLAEIRILLDIDFVTPAHHSMLKICIQQVLDLLPVRIQFRIISTAQH
jgi:hypothetical protein